MADNPQSLLAVGSELMDTAEMICRIAFPIEQFDMDFGPRTSLCGMMSEQHALWSSIIERNDLVNGLPHQDTSSCSVMSGNDAETMHNSSKIKTHALQ